MTYIQWRHKSTEGPWTYWDWGPLDCVNRLWRHYHSLPSACESFNRTLL